MKKARFLVGVLLITLILSACAPTLDEAKADFCSDLGTFGQAVIDLNNLGVSATVDQLNDAKDAAADAWGDLKSSAETLADVQVDEMEDSYDAVQNDVSQAISGDTTLAEAGGVYAGGLADLLADVSQISITVCQYGQ